MEVRSDSWEPVHAEEQAHRPRVYLQISSNETCPGLVLFSAAC